VQHCARRIRFGTLLFLRPEVKCDPDPSSLFSAVMDRKDSTITPPQHPPAVAGYLAGGGEMAAPVRSKDGSRTPLGPIEHWPPTRRTTVSPCLASKFPIGVIRKLAPNYVNNDGYRAIRRDAHPFAVGQSFDVTRASAAPAVGEPLASARRRTAVPREPAHGPEQERAPGGDLLHCLIVTGPRQSRGIARLFHPVTETAAMMPAERRTRAARAGDALPCPATSRC
jgi:hypothetical protein